MDRPALTWDELAMHYDAASGGRRARTQPMEAIFNWAASQTDKFTVHNGCLYYTEGKTMGDMAELYDHDYEDPGEYLMPAAGHEQQAQNEQEQQMSEAAQAVDAMKLRGMYKALHKPFPVEAIQFRKGGGGTMLAYIDARQVAKRLDHAVGPFNWQCRYTHTGDLVICEIGIKVAGEWIWKADGAGETKVEAEKGAASTAFKRAAVRWGVGVDLYDFDTTGRVPEWYLTKLENWNA